MLSWGLLFWIVWIVMLLFHGAGWSRVDPAGRWSWGSGIGWFVLTGILALGLWGNPLPNK